jgi:hypothetical protein
LDNVNHPSHYQGKNGIESINVIEGFDLGFHLGNALKYILRAGKKGDRVEDIRKAIWYLNREIARHEKWEDPVVP